MSLYNKILVTIDCSTVDEHVLEHVSKLAAQNDAAVSLLHVVHSHTLDQDRALKASAECAMEKHRERFEELGIDVDIILRSGEPEEEILRELEGRDYDLVAMATHGHSFLGSLVFGSVSRTLKHQADVPLLLIRS